MSIVVKLYRIKNFKCDGEKFARIEFRGHFQDSRIIPGDNEVQDFNEYFRWELSEAITAEEVLTVRVMSRSFWGTIRCMSTYTLRLSMVLSGNQLYVTDVLENLYNETVPYFVFDFLASPETLCDLMMTVTAFQALFPARKKTMLGIFKMKIAVVWSEPDRMYYHKWLMLTDPKDLAAGAKGYLKCNIIVMADGEAPKIPHMSDQDDNYIQSCLMSPLGVPTDLQCARFIVKVYRADGLPMMNCSVLANVRNEFTAESTDLVDPYVEVSFAGMTAYTSVKRNCNTPIWNEQIVFTEMFPSKSQRIKLQLKDNDPLHSNIIGTFFMDLGPISDDGITGFLPTFGPSYVYLYGSSRGCTQLDKHDELNACVGEGIAYRARLQISLEIKMIENAEYQGNRVEVSTIPDFVEVPPVPTNEFLLYGSIHDVNVIEKNVARNPLSFEMSMGTSGNNIDGNSSSLLRCRDITEIASAAVDTGTWQSTSQARRTATNDHRYYHIPYGCHKSSLYVRSVWPDHRRRMYNSNAIHAIVDKLEDGLMTTGASKLNNATVSAFKSALIHMNKACLNFAQNAEAAPLPSTKLDKERLRMCIQVMEEVAKSALSITERTTMKTFRRRLQSAHECLHRLKLICDDPQHTLPDVFVWMVSYGRRIAYCRIPAQDLIYSNRADERGRLCGKMQTIVLKWPGKAVPPGVRALPAQLHGYFWLGAIGDRVHYPDGLPPGYVVPAEIRYVQFIRIPPAIAIQYTRKHTFQLRAYIYQARSVIGLDASGLCDPYATVIIGEHSRRTQTLVETLNPTWDEMLVIDKVTLHSTIEHIKLDPPTVIIEIFHKDKERKDKLIGRSLAKPCIKRVNEACLPPNFLLSLEWYNIRRGDSDGGELLAAFELIEVSLKDKRTSFPVLPPAKVTNKISILPVPRGIRPTRSKFCVQVLFWGLRELKHDSFLNVNHPRVDIECAGKILFSDTLEDFPSNPNFAYKLKLADVELPDVVVYRSPLSIRVVDHQSYGRKHLVGNHTINSITRYLVEHGIAKEKETEEGKNSAIDQKALNTSNDTTITIEKEDCPLLQKNAKSYGSKGATPKIRHSEKLRPQIRYKRRQFTGPLHDDTNKDWWTVYVQNVESMKDWKKNEGIFNDDDSFSDMYRRLEPSYSNPTSPEATTSAGKSSDIPDSTLMKIYPHELEAVPEFNHFKDWLQTFELYRATETRDNGVNDCRIVGHFKGALQIYKYTTSNDGPSTTTSLSEPNIRVGFQNMPNNDPLKVLVRVYILKATDLQAEDMKKTNPCVALVLGSTKMTETQNYGSKQLNPIFGKCFQFEATFPYDTVLTVSVETVLMGTNYLIGETKIDIENRFYSQHRATCGLQKRYDERGYNKWRNAKSPTEILTKLCKDNKLDLPVYNEDCLKIGRTIFKIPVEDPEESENNETIKEHMALTMLHRWQEVPNVGTCLVPEHIESRALYNPSKPGVEQGRIHMWVEIFPSNQKLPGPAIDISPRKPQSYELRVIIWNTDDVVFFNDVFGGDKSSDIFVKGWLNAQDDHQSTDTHFRSFTGEGNFNWRFIYPFDYLEAEERIVITKKDTVLCSDETELKIPAKLELQVRDAELFDEDDFLGALTMDLNCFPRGARSSRQCTLDMLRMDGTVPMMNIFKQKRVRGWWPVVQRDERGNKLTGKVEVELHLLTRDEANRMPAGLGRRSPDPLDKPNRPDTSFTWFVNPLKTIRYIAWPNYKTYVYRTAIVVGVILVFLLFVYTAPAYMARNH